MAARFARLANLAIFLVLIHWPDLPAALIPHGTGADALARLVLAYVIVRVGGLAVTALVLVVQRRRYLDDLAFHWRSLIDFGGDLPIPETAGRVPRVGLALMAMLYLITRLVRLTALPPFSDEGCFARWAQLATRGHPFASLACNGKKPLFFWIGGLVHAAGVADPVVALRLASVGAGLAMLACTMVLAARIGGRTAALCAGVLLVASPFGFFHTRIGLIDATVVAWMTAVALASFQMLRPGTSRWTVLATGLALGAAFLTKTYAYAFVILPLAFLVQKAVVQRRAPRAWEVKRILFATLIAVGLLVLVIEMAHSPYFDRESGSFFHVPGASAGPAAWTNIAWLAVTLTREVGPLVLLAAAAGMILSLARPARGDLAGVLSLAILVAAVVLVARRPFDRYVLFALPLLAIQAGLALARLGEFLGGGVRSRAAVGVALTLLAVPGAYESERQAADPASSWTLDRAQYVEGWASGYGGMEMVRFLEAEARRGPIAILATRDGPQTSLPTIYLERDPSATVQCVDWLLARPALYFLGGDEWPKAQDLYLARDAPLRLDPRARVLVTANADWVPEERILRLNPGARVLARFPRPGNRAALSVVEIPRGGN